MNMSIYDFKVNTIQGKETTLADYKGKVLLIVNTASKCGLTPQYEGLQKLYEANREKGLEILGFPCNQFKEQEPGSSEDIQEFCRVNYGVTFPMFEKVDVLGDNAHPLFAYLTSQKPTEDHDITWNFAKFLIDREGNVVKRFEPKVTPAELEGEVEAQLKQ
jgi:glutathione peroxidase